MSLSRSGAVPEHRGDSADPLPTVEGYAVESLVGQGGAASVYTARRLSDGTRVALKMVRPEVAKLLGVDRFLREIRIAGSIESPHLVPLLGWGESGGLPYYAMPFHEAGTLRDRLTREHQLPLSRALAIARSLLSALDTLHAHGIVHRDVKPGNILLGSDDSQVMLADYGIARAIDVAALEPVTSTGLVLGTPTYMSPEQGAGDTVDARADLYSWGCVLYEMLVGEAPFSGATAQVIIGRHISETPPSIQIPRPDLPPGVEPLIRRALSKAPADRFQNVAEAMAALDQLDLGAVPALPARGPPRRRTRRMKLGLAGVVVAVAAVAWKLLSPPVGLDPRRVVVFPFDSGGGGIPAEGMQLAILIGSALERTEPMRWLDGASLLGRSALALGEAPTTRQAAAVTRDAGARYFLRGSLLRLGDSLRVIVRLHDLENPRDPLTRSLTGAATGPPADLALGAILELLPRLVGVGPHLDVVRLRERNPAAVVRWLQGEVEYRASRMASALALLEDALTLDSTLAPAALRGALAASWINASRASSLIAQAERHAALLSPRERLLAVGLRHYLAGDANGAMRAIRRVLVADSGWADPWLLAGEVQLHLLPTEGLDSAALAVVPTPRHWPLEQMAEDGFQRAVALDSFFTPPLTHLAEMALRAGDVSRAARLVERLRRAGAEAGTVRRLELAHQCVAGDVPVDWTAQVRQSRLESFHVASQLVGAIGVAGRTCAERALRAVLAADTAYGAEDWGALVLLHGMLVARGQPALAVGLVDSAVASGLSPALGLYVLDDVGNVDVGRRGSDFIGQLGDDFDARGAASLWLITTWHSAKGDRAAVERAAAVLARRAEATTDRLDRLMAAVAAAYADLGRGDTLSAIAAFEALTPTAPHQDVEGSLWESLATERLVLARLLLARGEWARAHRVASVFDHPGIFMHQLFLPASLAVREQAALALEDTALAGAARRRLEALSGSTPQDGR